jgi:hypothetical protein
LNIIAPQFNSCLPRYHSSRPRYVRRRHSKQNLTVQSEKRRKWQDCDQCTVIGICMLIPDVNIFQGSRWFIYRRIINTCLQTCPRTNCHSSNNYRRSRTPHSVSNLLTQQRTRSGRFPESGVYNYRSVKTTSQYLTNK